MTVHEPQRAWMQGPAGALHALAIALATLVLLPANASADAITLRASLEADLVELEQLLAPAIEARRQRDFAQRHLASTEADLRADNDLMQRLHLRAEEQERSRTAPLDQRIRQASAERHNAQAELDALRLTREAEREARRSELDGVRHAANIAEREYTLAQDMARSAAQERRNMENAVRDAENEHRDCERRSRSGACGDSGCTCFDRAPSVRMQLDSARQRERDADRAVWIRRDARNNAWARVREAERQLDNWWRARQAQDVPRENALNSQWHDANNRANEAQAARDAIILAAVEAMLAVEIARETREREAILATAQQGVRISFDADFDTLSAVETFQGALRATLHTAAAVPDAVAAHARAAQACSGIQSGGQDLDAACGRTRTIGEELAALAQEEERFGNSRFYRHCITARRAEARGEMAAMEVTADPLALARRVDASCGSAMAMLTEQEALRLVGGRWDSLAVLAEFPRLRALSIEEADIANIEGLARITQLESLTLRDLRGARLPERLPPRLERLHIAGAHPRALPMSWWTNATVRELVLEGCVDRHLPPVDRMPLLEALAVHGSDMRRVRPNMIPEHLVALDMRHNDRLRARSVRRTCRRLGIGDASCLY